MKGTESNLRNLIKQQEDKLARIQNHIEELKQKLADHLAFVALPIKHPGVQKVVDNHNYCGKILYTSKKAANGARLLINRDLVKSGKKKMKRSYFCRSVALNFCSSLDAFPGK
jgi:hypothetical protein